MLKRTLKTSESACDAITLQPHGQQQAPLPSHSTAAWRRSRSATKPCPTRPTASSTNARLSVAPYRRAMGAVTMP
eukprot:6357004-Prymnesium_polylepis.2